MKLNSIALCACTLGGILLATNAYGLNQPQQNPEWPQAYWEPVKYLEGGAPVSPSDPAAKDYLSIIEVFRNAPSTRTMRGVYFSPFIDTRNQRVTVLLGFFTKEVGKWQPFAHDRPSFEILLNRRPPFIAKNSGAPRPFVRIPTPISTFAGMPVYEKDFGDQIFIARPGLVPWIPVTRREYLQHIVNEARKEKLAFEKDIARSDRELARTRRFLDSITAGNAQQRREQAEIWAATDKVLRENRKWRFAYYDGLEAELAGLSPADAAKPVYLNWHPAYEHGAWRPDAPHTKPSDTPNLPETSVCPSRRPSRICDEPVPQGVDGLGRLNLTFLSPEQRKRIHTMTLWFADIVEWEKTTPYCKRTDNRDAHRSSAAALCPVALEMLREAEWAALRKLVNGQP